MRDKSERKSQAMPRYSRHWDTPVGFIGKPSTRTLPTLADIGMNYIIQKQQNNWNIFQNKSL